MRSSSRTSCAHAGTQEHVANTSITSLCMYLFHSHVTCSATSITNTSLLIAPLIFSQYIAPAIHSQQPSNILNLLVFTKLSSFSLFSFIQLSIISSHPVQVLIATLDVSSFEQCYCLVFISLLSLTFSLSLHLILKSHYYM